MRRSLCVAGVPVSIRPARQSIARQSTQRTAIQPPTTGQPLPPVMQNGCENAEANDVPPQKPLAGMMLLCIMLHALLVSVPFSFCEMWDSTSYAYPHWSMMSWGRDEGQVWYHGINLHKA